MHAIQTGIDPVIPGDPALFRQIWRGFGSAVALVSTALDGQRYAMLATAVTSVSMDPPSLLVCVNRSASAYTAVKERGAFSLGIMPADATDICAAIARASAQDRFTHGTWLDHGPTDGSAALPWLAETQATLFCAVDMATDYGTHTIFVARVLEAAQRGDVNPLIYCDGRYGAFTDAPAGQAA